MSRLGGIVFLVGAAAYVLSAQPAAEFLGTITDIDLAQARRPQPPWELKGAPGRKSFDLRGDSKRIYQDVARAFSLEAVFDGDYQPSQGVRFLIQDVDYKAALHALEAVTGTIIVPIGDRVFLAAKDTPQKRTEVEPSVAVVLAIPQSLTIQDAQELARSVQQTMEIPKFTIDTQRRLVLFRDRVSRARPAQLLFEQLLYHRPQVAIELEFLDFSRNSSVDWGLNLPSRSALVNFGRPWRSTPSIPAGFARFLTFGGGKTFLGLGLADAELFATFSRSQAQTLLRSELRSIDGQPVSFHVGDRYPILTAGYFGSVAPPGEKVFTPPPTVNFEDLGLVVKVTPHMHGVEEVTLEVEAEFKVLTGTTLNGIPVIANRKFQSKARLKHGEWAVLAGLMSVSEARNITGMAGLASLPLAGRLLRQNGKSSDRDELLILLKPSLISLPPTEAVTRELYVGTETRPLTPL